MARVEEPTGGDEMKKNLVSTLLWRIENIAFWDPKFHGFIASPAFEFLNTDTYELLLCLEGKNEDDKKFTCSLRGLKELRSLDYEWSVLDGDGLPVVTRMVRNATLARYQWVDLLDWPTYQDVIKAKKYSFLPNDTLTVRCRFWKSDKDFEQTNYISGYTRLPTDQKSFLWRIKKFSSLQLEQEVIYPFVLHFEEREMNFKLKFYLKGLSLTDARVSFEIHLEEAVQQTLTTNISILDHENRTMKSLKSKNNLGCTASPSNLVKRLPKFVSRHEIMNRKSDWLRDDDLILLCQLSSVMSRWKTGIDKSYNGPENHRTEITRNSPSAPQIARIETEITDPRCTTCTVPETSNQTTFQRRDGSVIPLHKTNSVTTLQEDLLSLYTDHTLSDFELRSGDASIPVHKVVLSARSPVFKAMFCGDMKESKSDFLQVPDLDVHTLNRMLTFMYTGTLDHLEWESAAKLYYAADKYQVQTLKQECLYLLQSGISVQNVSDILELEDRHQDGDLELFVHDFLARHYDEVILSEEWRKFLDRNAPLAGKAMRDAYKKRLQREC